ncbi:MAG: protein kinase [Deltaproteobacteria bacterium]|nr:protein kinase [Deltaproteobacteria bacterium]
MTIECAETSLALAMQVERLGKYEIVRHLAKGGMANVFLARVSGEGGFERHVVLKMIGDEQEDTTLVPMFLDEARIIATLHHQHIAQVYEVGHTDGSYYLAMEYVHGETVRTVLESTVKLGQRLPLDFGLTVACAAASGLHHAHERRDASGASLGIVHRDVTPSNVLVSYDGSIKVIDFGIAKAARRKTRTATGFIKGKAGYMAPEQVKGYAVDRRSDVFALGVLAYELTTQKRAFHAETQFEQLEQIAKGRIAPPSALVPRYPVELEYVVMRALELDPDDRYPDAAAFRTDLERVSRGLGLTLGPDVITDVLVDLYGPRPEPWLLEPGSIDYDLTPPVADLPVSIEVIEQSERSFARGSDELPAVRPPDPAPAPAPRASSPSIAIVPKGSSPSIVVRPPTQPPAERRPSSPSLLRPPTNPGRAPSHPGAVPIISIPIATAPTVPVASSATPVATPVTAPSSAAAPAVTASPAAIAARPVTPSSGAVAVAPTVAARGMVPPPLRAATLKGEGPRAVAAASTEVVVRPARGTGSMAPIAVEARDIAGFEANPTTQPLELVDLEPVHDEVVGARRRHGASTISVRPTRRAIYAAVAVATGCAAAIVIALITRGGGGAPATSAPTPSVEQVAAPVQAPDPTPAPPVTQPAPAPEPVVVMRAEWAPIDGIAALARDAAASAPVETPKPVPAVQPPPRVAAAKPAPVAPPRPAPAKRAAAKVALAATVAKPTGKEPAKSAPPKTAATTPGHVMLHVVTDPPDSTVVLDGVRMGRTPFHAEVPARKEVWLKVRRFDRLPVATRVLLDRDVSWQVTLPHKPAGAPRQASNP